MELTEFAERILAGTSLPDKLLTPEVVTDDSATARAVPEVPGRPEALRIDGPRRTVPFPGLTADSDDATRGTAMHFFANHELLAIELMAVFLLRFPDAPSGLRKAILHTIREEQEHMRLYVERMAELGVELGHVPVSRFFWDCLRDMRSPHEYLAGMSLTLEQANLDFSAHYLQRFREIGDARSADVLQRVYDDEIGHVKLGVLWMDRLKAPNDARSLWPRYVESLRAPLTPARGRTNPFDALGRERAGLPQGFIDRVRTYRHSKGRDPRVFWFNPGSEAAWAVFPHVYQPTKAVCELQRDLEIIPMVFASEDDVVLVEQEPRVEFLASLLDLGFTLPEFSADEESLADRTLGSFQPWGCSPDAEPVSDRIGARRPAGVQRELFSKAWSATILKDLLSSDQSPRSAQRCLPSDVGVECASTAEVEGALEAVRRRGQRPAIKAAFGTAGRSSVREFSAADVDVNRRWVDSVLRSQGSVVVEPWLDRVLDLSVLIDVVAPGDVNVLGVTRFLTDKRGQYRGTSIGPWLKEVDEELRRFVVGSGKGPWWVIRELEQVGRVVGDRLAESGHRGPAGVDALIFRDAAGDYRLKPIVEVNPRYTMGHVALRVASHVAPGVSGTMEVHGFSALRLQGARNFAELAAKSPKPTTRERSGRILIDGGTVWLTDPERAKSAALVLRIHN